MVTPTALRATRRRLGLSQRALAEALGVHWNTIARWERGQMPIQHPRILQLALERLAQLRPT